MASSSQSSESHVGLITRQKSRRTIQTKSSLLKSPVSFSGYMKPMFQNPLLLRSVGLETYKCCVIFLIFRDYIFYVTLHISLGLELQRTKQFRSRQPTRSLDYSWHNAFSSPSWLRSVGVIIQTCHHSSINIDSQCYNVNIE